MDRIRPRGTREHAPGRDGSRLQATCAPALDVAANPATLRALMSGADAGTRERLAAAVQRRHGNAALQRLVDPASGDPGPALGGEAAARDVRLRRGSSAT